MRVCTIDGCDSKHEAKGFCDKHYQKFKKYGDPLKVVKPTANMDVLGRFYHYANKSVGCWEWSGEIDKYGYGKIFDNGKRKLSHRFSYELHFGVFDFSLYVLHKCDNPRCVNPDHLFLGTAKDNYDDAKSKNRHSHGGMHGNSKATKEDVLFIRSSRLSLRKLSDILNLDSSTISAIRRFKTWKHVKDHAT